MEVMIETTPRAETDLAWKEILRLYLKDFFELCWSKAHQEVDWDKPYEFLEQELQVVGIKEELGTKVVDKLFKLYLKNGQEQWVLCHIELQSTRKTDFPTRMYVYDYRIYDRYQKNIASLAILLDNNSQWRPNQYSRKIWGSETTKTYEVLKVLDFKARKEELLISDNPFALVILAQLTALETASSPESRLVSKLELARYLHRHGWNVEKRKDLYLFLDILLGLNESYTVKYLAELKKLEEELNVDLTSSAERYGFQRGMEQGMQQGMQQGVQKGEGALLLRQLQYKFKEVPPIYLQQIEKANADTLLKWGERVLESGTLEEVFEDQIKD